MINVPGHRRLSARDAVHQILSFDVGFDGVGSIARLS